MMFQFFGHISLSEAAKNSISVPPTGTVQFNVAGENDRQEVKYEDKKISAFYI